MSAIATKRYAIVGSPVVSSLSPYLHNALYELMGIEAVYERLESKNLKAILSGEEDSFTGFSVTSPLKEQAATIAKTLDSTARDSGSVNTLHRTNSGWNGYNTDGQAIVSALRHHLPDLELKTALLLGGGPTARSIAISLQRTGIAPTFALRSPSSLEKFAEKQNFDVSPLPASGQYDLLINATSAWKHDATSLLIETCRSVEAQVRFSVHYQENDSILFDTDPGAVQISGLEMFIFQALQQIAIWHGVLIDYQDARQLFEEDYSDLLYADSDSAS